MPNLRNQPTGRNAMNYLDLDQIWGDLKEGIDHVFQRQGMSKTRYLPNKR